MTRLDPSGDTGRLVRLAMRSKMAGGREGGSIGKGNQLRVLLVPSEDSVRLKNAYADENTMPSREACVNDQGLLTWTGCATCHFHPAFAE